jgi:hypothetical protein
MHVVELGRTYALRWAVPDEAREHSRRDSRCRNVRKTILRRRNAVAKLCAACAEDAWNEGRGHFRPSTRMLPSLSIRNWKLNDGSLRELVKYRCLPVNTAS